MVTEKNPEEGTCLKYSLLYLISSQKLQKIRKKAIMPCKYRNLRIIKMKISGNNLNYLEF